MQVPAWTLAISCDSWRRPCARFAGEAGETPCKDDAMLDSTLIKQYLPCEAADPTAIGALTASNGSAPMPKCSLRGVEMAVLASPGGHFVPPTAPPRQPKQTVIPERGYPRSLVGSDVVLHGVTPCSPCATLFSSRIDAVRHLVATRIDSCADTALNSVAQCPLALALTPAC